MLAQHLGATLVEIGADRLGRRSRRREHDGRLRPRHRPDHAGALSGAALQAGRDGQPAFPAFAAKIEPTEFAPGKTFGTGTMPPVDWMVRWAEGLEPSPPQPERAHRDRRGAVARRSASTSTQYLTRRAKDWADRGLHRDRRRLADAERAVEVLGRRPARRVHELGATSETSATRPGRRRASPSRCSCASCCDASSRR